jgi:acyl carrier protein
MDAKQREQVREALAQFWEETRIAVEETEDVEGLIDELDSQSAIDVVIRVEKILGVEIPEEKVIRPGGYDSKQQFVDDFLGRLDRFLAKKA